MNTGKLLEKYLVLNKDSKSISFLKIRLHVIGKGESISSVQV